jgi:hypothetical protein
MFTPIEKAFEEVSKVLDSKEKEHPEYLKIDKIFPAVSDLFDSKVGKEFSDSELEKIYKEGEERYSKKIPPGFEDFKKKQNGCNKRLYGDVIIWKELIRKANDSSKTLIFVTDDRKEDWWNIRNGETIGPREELIKEFHDETGLRILIYNSDSFLRYAQDKMKIEIEESSIQEVQSIRDVDERINTIQLNFSPMFDLNDFKLDTSLLNTFKNIYKSAEYFQKQISIISQIDVNKIRDYKQYLNNYLSESIKHDAETNSQLDISNFYSDDNEDHKQIDNSDIQNNSIENEDE